MSNLDFVSVPLGKYIQCNLDFGSTIKNPPSIFSVNYFLKGHNAKLTLDWSLLHQKGSSSSFPVTRTFTGEDQHTVTFQASVGF